MISPPLDIDIGVNSSVKRNVSPASGSKYIVPFDKPGFGKLVELVKALAEIHDTED